MREHTIPIQLSQYSNFILGTGLSCAKINYLNSLKIDIENFNIHINFSEINLEHFPKNGTLIISVKKSQEFFSKAEYSPDNKTKSNINSLDESHFLTYIEEYEFCPIQDHYNSTFYYNTFIDILSSSEQKAFELSDEFNPTYSKIGGYQSGKHCSISTESFDFDNPWILLLQINTGEILDSEPQFMKWFIQRNSLINKDFTNIIFEYKNTSLL